MKVRELQARIAEIKSQGNALWEKAEADTKNMSAEAREEYMVTVREKDVAIRTELTNAQNQLKSAELYQDGERVEITRAAEQQDSSPAEFKSFGELLQAVACTHPAIASQFPRDKREDLAYKMRNYQAAASGMSVGTPSDGGYMVRKQWTAEFMMKAKQQSVLLPLCSRVPIGDEFDGLEYPYIDETSRVAGSRWGGVQVFWKAEAATVTAKKPKIGKGEVRLEEIMGLAYATNRLMRDATALESILVQGFQEEFGIKADDSVMRGGGAGTMLGFLNSPALISVTRDADDLVTVSNMLARLQTRLKPSAVWLHHADWLPKLIRLKLGDTPVFIPPGGLPNAPGGVLLGKPLIEMEHCSAVGTAGDLILFDPKSYVYIEKENEGVMFDTSMHVRFEYDEMAFRWIYRINGQPIQRTALTPMQGSNTVSGFVTVAA